jgi:rubrerythrin
VSDILDFAIDREAEAHDFYVSLARRVRRPDVRQSVEGFAIDELQHRLRLEAIKAGETSFGSEEVGSLDIAEALGEAEPRADMTYRELLVLAMQREKAAFRLYTNLASIARKPELRDALLKLAQEEAQHKLRLEIEYEWELS